MATIIKDQKLVRVGKPVTPDSRKRVVLPKTVVREGVTYYVYHNSLGQIILDPQVSIPASELWLFENKEVLASIDRGMRESLKGKTIKRGSFAKTRE
ncbi:MAG: hypothetical protein A2Z77_00915 [Chloroflexi bacterium RBG_13_51_36]|nr:MAG: hypothetical protein A2Z77_00915 [Chloroflexi bacterium RBG_13_51_36]